MSELRKAAERTVCVTRLSSTGLAYVSRPSEAVPCCSEVDFSDPEDICGYAHLLISAYQRAGGFCYDTKSTPTLREIVKEAKKWLFEVGRTIGSAATYDVPKILQPYDFLHRIAHRRPADSRYLADWYDKAFLARVAGDRRVGEYELMQHVSTLTRQNGKDVPYKYLRWKCAIIDAWIDESRDSGRFDGISLAEALVRVATILRENLSAYFTDDKRYKRKLVGTYLPAFDGIDGYDCTTLKAAHAMLGALTGDYVSQALRERYGFEIIKALSSADGLNVHDRVAYAMDLECLLQEISDED